MESNSPLERRLDSTSSSASRQTNHELVPFDDVLAKDDIRRSMTIQKSRETRAISSSSAKSKSNSAQPRKGSIISEQKSLYERIIGKTPFSSSAVKPSPSQPLKDSFVGWFTKDTAEERAIRSLTKSYRTRLMQEMQYTSRAIAKYQKKLTDQVAEYERQERQLVSWGLKAALPKFHVQAWYRIERCRLYEKVASEIEDVIDNRQKKAQLYLQNFEESTNRRNKFSVKSTEEFCMPPEKLILQDSTVLSLQDRLKRMDVLYAVASKQFMQLEPEFDWKDQKDRKKEFLRILRTYNELPKYSELDNIEADLSWKSFCNWIADRSTKQKKVEQDFFDFIEDSREVEGRLFQRWQTCVLLSLSSSSSSVDRESSRSSEQHLSKDSGTGASNGDMNDARQARPTPLKVTPASIRAFIQYFATDIIGLKYSIPRDCIAANKALTEALFYRRIAPYVFRYQDAFQRKQDEYWRLQCQRCRLVDPRLYHVMNKYLVSKPPPTSSSPSPDSSSEAHTRDSSTENVPASACKNATDSSTLNSPNVGSSRPVSLKAAASSTSGSKAHSVTPHVCQCYYCQTLSFSQRLQRLPVYEIENGVTMQGQDFARSARVLSWLGLVTTPREMATYLTLACKWILRDAIDVSGSRSIIGADEMVPLFTMVLVHAQIPNIHMILRILTEFGEYDEQGDISYCIANLEGSMRFLMDFGDDIPSQVQDHFLQTEMFASIAASVVGVKPPPVTTATATSAVSVSATSSPAPAAVAVVINGQAGVEQESAVEGGTSSERLSSTPPSATAVPFTTATPIPSSIGASSHVTGNQKRLSGNGGGGAKGFLFSPESMFTSPQQPLKRMQSRSVDHAKEDSEAMEQLGEWLRDQKTMEDTIAILQSDGWML